MVYGEIIRQGQLFLLAAALGAGLLLCYDFLRIFRRLIRHKTWGIAAEDLLFWLCCALVMFGFMYRMNEGVIRGFLVLGTAVGMVLYSTEFTIYNKNAWKKQVKDILCNTWSGYDCGRCVFLFICARSLQIILIIKAADLDLSIPAAFITI